MDAPHLLTRIHPPVRRPNMVARPRLTVQLHEALRLGRRLTLLSAPAGFGKTTLLNDWLASVSHPYAWLSLDESDNDPGQFLSYLAAALYPLDSKLGHVLRSLLQSAPLPSAHTLMISLINDLQRFGRELIILLDDYHLVTSPAVHELVQFLLDYQPYSVHLVISTREDPPLKLPRLRAGGYISDIHQHALRFTPEETAAFFEHTLSLSVTTETLRALQEHTEGWIAGLQLAALALQASSVQEDAFMVRFSGKDRYIADYLIAEVLEHQPDEVRSFLLQTSLLDRLSAPLCDAVTGRSGSQAMLELLDKANMFVVPLDHQREWYRYRRLFVEALQTMLDDNEKTKLHQRALHWYEMQGLHEQALTHALEAATYSRNFEDVVRLLPPAAEEALQAGNVLAVQRWLSRLPEDRARDTSHVAVHKAWVSVLTGDLGTAENYVGIAEEQLRTTSVSLPTLGRVLALRSFIALMVYREYGQASELARRALEFLKEPRSQWHLFALGTMAEAQERTRPLTEAITTRWNALQAGRAVGNELFATTTESFLASALNEHGERRKAIEVCQDGIERSTDNSGYVSPLAGMLLSQLGALHYEANDLEKSRAYFDQGRALGEQLGLEGTLAFSYGFSAPVFYALGEPEAAFTYLRKAYQIALSTQLSDADVFLAMEAKMRLKAGDLSFARNWAEKAGWTPAGTPSYLSMEAHLVYARLLLAQGCLEDAQEWLVTLEHFARERELYRRLLTVYLLQALVEALLENQEKAREAILKAVLLAAPERYYRAFLDEDERLLGLLRDVRSCAPAFVDRLLAFANASPIKRIVPIHPSVETLKDSLPTEPLSERELEVLGLIAAGYSNPEIAHKLSISLATVKRHINNLYSKLGVESRTQAVAKGRALFLL